MVAAVWVTYKIFVIKPVGAAMLASMVFYS